MQLPVNYDLDFAIRRKLMSAFRDRLSVARELDDIVESVRRIARAIFSADGVAFVLNEDGYCRYVEENAVGPLWKGRRFPMQNCISGWSMLNAKTAVIEDVYADARIPHDVYRQTFVASLIMAPVSRSAPVAAIGAYWRHRQTFSGAIVTLAEELAAEVDKAMRARNAQQTESLTG